MWHGDGWRKRNLPKVICRKRGSVPHGNDVEISKLECVGHVQNRMGSRLRRLCKDLQKTKLSAGKIIQGKCRLVDSVIDEFQPYYGNAIRKNR